MPPDGVTTARIVITSYSIHYTKLYDDDDEIETLRQAYDFEFESARKKGNFRNLSIDDTA